MSDPAPRAAAPAACVRGYGLSMLRPIAPMVLNVANDDGGPIGPRFVEIGRPRIVGLVRTPEISA